MCPSARVCPRRSLAADYRGVATKYGDVSASNMHALSTRHFPLCMSTLMNALNSERHLRHGGRQQLGLFLKASLDGNKKVGKVRERVFSVELCRRAQRKKRLA